MSRQSEKEYRTKVNNKLQKRYKKGFKSKKKSVKARRK
jgi:hypothetical protein